MTITKKEVAAALKTAHIFCVSSTSGGLSATLVLLNQEPAAAIAIASLRLFSILVTWGGLGLFVTSCLFSLFFEWGILRFRWIALKWLLLLGVIALSWLVFRPTLSGLAGTAEAGLLTEASRAGFAALLATARAVGSAISLAMLAAIGLAALKPRLGKTSRTASRLERIVGIVLLAGGLAGAAYFAVSELSLRMVRALPIADLRPAGLPDGDYAGAFTVRSNEYKVTVRISRGRISDIKADDSRGGDYIGWARGVFARVVASQTAQVEAVAGATTSSKAYLKAIEEALLKAGVRAR
jgi:uncharacterized protein with FMN-binding domain